MHSRMKWLVGGVAVATVLALSGCAGAAEPANTDGGGAAQVIKLGAPVTVTGDAAFVGLAASGAFEVAQEIINADPETYLGSADRSLELTTKDAGADAAKAIAIGREFVADAGTLAIVGPSTSPQALALAPFAQEQGIPLVIPHSPAAGLTDAGAMVFQIAMSNDILAKDVIEAGVPAADLKKVGVIISPDNNADLLAGQVATETLQDLGVEDVQFEIPFADQDYSAAITKMKDAGVDGIFIATNAGGSASAMVQADRVGLDVQWLGNAILINSTVLTNAGAAADGSIAATDYNPGLDTELNAEFKEKFKAATGNDADVYAAQAFSSVLAIAAAVKAIDPGESVTRESLATALAAVDNVEVVVGTGEMSFTDKRTSELAAALLQLDGDTWVTFE